MKWDKLKMSAWRWEAELWDLTICWPVIWLLASDSLAETRERVTAGWTVHFRYRTPESEECTQWELCPFPLSCGVTQTCIGLCKLIPRIAFYCEQQQTDGINWGCLRAGHFQSWRKSRGNEATCMRVRSFLGTTARAGLRFLMCIGTW